MLKMRLQRVGRRNDPSYRVVVTDSRTGPKSNKHVDVIGSYSAKMNRVEIDGEKAKEWMSKGVQVSPTVHNLLVNQGVIEGKKINVLPKKSPIIDEEKLKAEAEAKASAEAAAVEEAAQADEGTTDSKEGKEVETPAEETTEDTLVEEIAEPVEETPAEEEKKEETA